jgi:4-hydroxy-tetrahydrodipicolinate reductase
MTRNESPHRLVVHGAAGRMGRRVVACAAEPEAAGGPWRLVAGIERPGHPLRGADALALAGLPPGGVPVATAWDEPADVVIDFSLPEALPGIVASCVVVVELRFLPGRQRLAPRRVDALIGIA